ncbi:ABC-2 type transport system permease protein [Herbihabitans rhizosphaerae]|uniref:Transport permease protein n=1 Tax=Herbihabitans rhizosphaerae TaxID=1872711 RepID=A0A4Q7KDC4_9PSEU|nr:ABC transporter permease [Herbihabitans rhizosphaerae]RZS31126.1 ABC-2 type transport system permease protein [Herbihabitans rhizosphaerae]
MTTTTERPTRTDAPADAWGGTSMVTQITVLTGRSLRALRDPRMLIMSILQPLIMLTLFSQVFRSVAESPNFPKDLDYIDYLMPAILVTTGSQAAMWAGVGLANDLKNGALARFRTLPINMMSVLAARSLFDMVRNGLQLSILLIAATLLFGFGPAGGVLGVLAALALALVIGWGLAWVFLALAAWVRNLEVMQMIGMVAMFPLMFASSAFVTTDSLPGWLRVIAEINPLTYAIDASRGLALGDPSWSPVFGALITSGVIAAVGAVFAFRGVRKP